MWKFIYVANKLNTYFYCIAYSAGYISGLLCPRCSVWGLVCMFFLSQCVCVCVCVFVLFFHRSLFFCITVCYISNSNMGGQLDGLIPFWQPANCIVLTDLTCILFCVWLINSLSLQLFYIYLFDCHWSHLWNKHHCHCHCYSMGVQWSREWRCQVTRKGKVVTHIFTETQPKVVSSS